MPRPNAEAISFRYNASKVYLTYPRCNLSVQQVLENITSIKEVTHYAVCTELHQDGEPHVHALFQFGTKVNTVNQRYFDIQGFHPNIQNPKNVKNVLNYIKKDNNYISTWPEKRSYGEIFKEAKSREEFLQMVKENHPDDYAKSLERLEYTADKEYPRPTSPELEMLYEPKPWKLPSEINQWLSEEFPKKGNQLKL